MEEIDNNEIRSDKWLEMDTGSLIHQRDLILDKIMMLQSLQQSATNYSILCALQMAMKDVDYLLDLKTNGNTTNNNSMSLQ